MPSETQSTLLIPKIARVKGGASEPKEWQERRIHPAKHESGAYTFDDVRPAITMHRPDLPSPWINYLSNGKLHAFVSQAAGGFLWWKHSSKCRLTRYRMNSLPIDSPGFYIYIRHKDGRVWSPGF